MSGARSRGDIFPAVLAYLDSSLDSALPATAPGPFSSLEPLRTYFHNRHTFLRNKMQITDRVIYEDLEWRTRSDVRSLLEVELDGIQRGKSSLEFRKQLDIRVMVFNAADIIFHFFFPPGDGKDKPLPTQQPFWGAVQSLVMVCPRP